jgi:hypothetical protein
MDLHVEPPPGQPVLARTVEVELPKLERSLRQLDVASGLAVDLDGMAVVEKPERHLRIAHRDVVGLGRLLGAREVDR